MTEVVPPIASAPAPSLPPGADTRAALREQRRANRLLLEQIRGRQLERQARYAQVRELKESALLYDWVGPYFDLLNEMRRREPELAGPSAAWNRRYGKNYPLFQTEQELSLLRAPARVLAATNSFAIGLLEGLTSYTVGTGYTFRVAPRKGQQPPEELVAAVQAILDEFDERNSWQSGELPGLEPELFRRSVKDGEYILAHYAREDGRTDVRTVEPEQLTAKPGGDAREWLFGVNTAPDDAQTPRAYWIYWGDNPADGEEYDTDEIVHFRRNVERTIKRGLTDFSFDSLDGLTLASRLRTNLGESGAQQAAIVGVRQWATGTAQEVQAFNDSEADFQQTDPLSGRQVNVKRYRPEWEDVPKGMSYAPGPTAQNGAVHLQILSMLGRAASQRWNAPEWLGSGDASNNNYASSLTAESPFVITVKRNQKDYAAAYRRTRWIVLRNWCLKKGGVYAAGRLFEYDEIRKLLDVLAEAPSPEARQKLQEAQQAAIEIPLGVQSRQAYAQTQGRDFHQILADNEQYQQETGGDGQQLPMPGPGGPGGGGAPDQGPGGGGFESDEAADPEVRELLEAAAGRAGLVKKEITNKAGRKQTVWVKAAAETPGGGEGAKGKPAPARTAAKAAKPTVEGTLAKVEAMRANPTPEAVAELARHIQGHTVAELGQLKQQLGIKASGAKAELSRKIAERALAAAEAKAAKPGPTKPAAKPKGGKAKAQPAPAPEPERETFNLDDVADEPRPRPAAKPAAGRGPLVPPEHAAADRKIAHVANHGGDDALQHTGVDKSAAEMYESMKLQLENNHIDLGQIVEMGYKANRGAFPDQAAFAAANHLAAEALGRLNDEQVRQAVKGPASAYVTRHPDGSLSYRPELDHTNPALATFLRERAGAKPAGAPAGPAAAGAKAGPQAPEPGFTGTDAEGRRWVNGELVAAQEEKPAATARRTTVDAANYIGPHDKEAVDAAYQAVEAAGRLETPHSKLNAAMRTVAGMGEPELAVLAQKMGYGHLPVNGKLRETLVDQMHRRKQGNLRVAAGGGGQRSDAELTRTAREADDEPILEPAQVLASVKPSKSKIEVNDRTVRAPEPKKAKRQPVAAPAKPTPARPKAAPLSPADSRAAGEALVDAYNRSARIDRSEVDAAMAKLPGMSKADLARTLSDMGFEVPPNATAEKLRHDIEMFTRNRHSSFARASIINRDEINYRDRGGA